MPCTVSEAKHLAKLLVGGYPQSGINDPETYLTEIVAVFTQYDRDLVSKAIAPPGLPFDFPTFLPSVGQVNKWLAEKAAKQAELAKKNPLRRLPAPPYVRPPGCNYFEMVKKHGRPIGRFEKPSDRWNRHISEE